MRYPMRTTGRRNFILPVLLLGAAVFLGSSPAPAVAQEPPTMRSILTGYGAVGYNSTVGADELRNDFSGFVSLVPLARIHEELLVEGEVEFELEEGETNVVLEHVEVHYQGFERVQLRAGKFHLPIGVWMHTNWTNKMPTPPLLYEDTHGEASANALMPIPFDLGAMATWTIPVADRWRTSASLWVSQGPTGTFGGGHTHGDEVDPHDAGPEADAPLLELGSNFEDNNSDKMLGLTLRAVSAGGITLQGSGFRAAYDEAGELDVTAGNIALVWAPRDGPDPLFELKGEGTLMRQEYLLDGVVETVDLEGYYVQLSRRLGDWEPVARWSHLPRTVAGQGVLIPRRRQLALGLNYWIWPSVPVKAAYHREAGRADRFFIEWAVGF